MPEVAVPAADDKVAPAVPAPEVPAPEGEPAPPKTYSQEELDRITAKVKKNAQYRTRKEIEAYYQGRESARPAEPSKPAQIEEEKEPIRDQYDSYELFLDARAEFKGRKAALDAVSKVEREQAAKRATEAQAKTYQSFQAKVREKYPDIEERAESIGEITLPNGVSDAIADSELGPEILNHFVENPKDCERIAALAPSAAIREIGKLEARLEAAIKPPGDEPVKPAPVVTKQPSSAPAPIKPGGGAASPGNETPSDSDSIAEWMRKEAARERKKRHG